MGGQLFICPTPLGNLQDMPPRALQALRDADVVCAEDTRVTGKLLAALGVEGKRLERLDENVISQRASQIVQRVLAGQTIAYCTDAGMPGVSDPGLRLVRAAREAQAPVTVIPGPTAAATAYVTSGCVDAGFYFGGFLPRKDAARQALLRDLAPIRALGSALVFYESPNRLVGALESILRALPGCTLAVCRELTKLHEEVVRGPVAEVCAEFAQRDAVKGEIVLVIDSISPHEQQREAASASADGAARARELAAQGVRPKQIARQLADELGIPRNEAYELALQAKQDPSLDEGR